jgi:hypothetical protein
MGVAGHVQKIEQRCAYGRSAFGSGKSCRCKDLRQLIPPNSRPADQAADTVEVGQWETLTKDE